MSTTKARQTGTLVTLCEGDDLPWMLICEDHDLCCEFHTKREAIDHRSSPIDWCEECGDNWRRTNYPTTDRPTTNTEETNMNTNPNSSIPEKVQAFALDIARSYRDANSDEDRIKTDAHMSALIATVRLYGADLYDLAQLGRKMDELSGAIEVLSPVPDKWLIQVPTTD